MQDVGQVKAMYLQHPASSLRLCNCIRPAMAALKRKASFVNPMLDVRTQRRIIKIDTSALENEDEPCEPLRHLAPPELVKLRLGAPTIILGFDVETHDWNNTPRVSRTGEFHWFTRTHSTAITFPRIVELGWAFGSTTPGAPLTKKSKRVIPDGWAVSQKAFDFHKISTEDAQKGERLQDVMKEFLEDVRQVCGQGGRICAHHFEFDAGVVQEELIRCGLEDLRKEWVETARAKGYCTMNPAVGRWIWQCMGRETGPVDARHTKGLSVLLRILAPDREDLFKDINRHVAIVDAEGTRLVYAALLQRADPKNAVEADDDTQPYDPNSARVAEDTIAGTPVSPKTARMQWELRFAKTLPLTSGIKNDSIAREM